jgi:hypothetical protein
MKIHPMGAELFHVNGRTEMTDLIVFFRNFANPSKSIFHKPNKRGQCVLKDLVKDISSQLTYNSQQF